jgi:hypothetical protein
MAAKTTAGTRQPKITEPLMAMEAAPPQLG